MKKIFKKNTKAIFPALIFILGLSVIPFNHVSADQYWAGQNGNIQVDVTLDNGLTYAPNDAFSVTGAIYSPTVNTVDMRVVAAGIFRQIIPVSAVNAGSIFQTISIVGPTANAGTFQAIFKTGVEENGGNNPPNGCYYTIEAKYQAFRWARFYVKKWEGVSYTPIPSAHHAIISYELQNGDEYSPWSAPVTDEYLTQAHIIQNATKEIASTEGHTGFRFSDDVKIYRSDFVVDYVIPQACTRGYTDEPR